jgi:hemerythrin
MALITWSDKFSVQVKQLDEQHKKLIEILNRLHDAMKVGKGKEILEEVLGSLIIYTRKHFAAEEELMKVNNYPGYAVHKQEHNQLVVQVLDVQKQTQAGVVLSQQVMSFLKNWLETHIQGTDKKYGPFLNEKGLS